MNKWDSFWSNTNFLFVLAMRTHRKLVFKMYQKLLDSLNLKNPNVIELGCGSGMLTLKILKKYGGSATVLDNSKEALKLAEEKFKKHNFKAKILCRDLLRFKPKKKFDIVHSEGLIEHFSNEKQKKIIETHKKCVKKNGYILITVPRPAWYYRITKWFLEKINKWPFGFEKAMSKNELKKVLEKYGLKVVKFAEYSRYSFALAKI